MKIIDLSQTIESGMPVYPGDPEVSLEKVHSLKTHGWRLTHISLGSHTGTHVDAFSHMDESGTTLEKIPLDAFIGKAKLVSIEKELPSKTGLVFDKDELTERHFEQLYNALPLFVVIGNQATLSVELEKKLLQAGILTFTDLINLEELPKEEIFTFFGIPLKLKNCDGSPIRAFAIVE